MRVRVCCVLSFAFTASMMAQQPGGLGASLEMLANTPGVTGYETAVTQQIMAACAGLHPVVDSMGNVRVTMGAGAPRRLIVTPVDEPGFIVSRIDKDGYLRVQRLPQSGLMAHYNELQNAQPMVIGTRSGKLVPAVSAGLSIHLEPGRTLPPDPDDLDNFYLDMGASSDAEVRQTGVSVLSPVAAERHLLAVGETQWAGTAAGDRYGAAVLMALARALAKAPPAGTTTIAFATQQWVGSRGLKLLLTDLHPDELIYVGKGRAAARADAGQPALAQSAAMPGEGVVVYGEADDAAVVAAAAASSVQLHRVAAAPFVVRGYDQAIALPARTLHLGVPVRWPETAGETVDENDMDGLLRLLGSALGVAVQRDAAAGRAAIPYPAMPARPSAAPSALSTLETLSRAYGVSEHETMVRQTVAQLLPAWAHPVADEASGNLVLRFGDTHAAPRVAFLAHTDELGFRIRAIDEDGMLELENKGGGTPAFYWGHPAVVHTSAGMRGAVVALPPEFESPQFHFPADFRAPARLYVGASSAAAVGALGIRVGDTVTIPKRFLHLLNDRVSVRGLDDRVGCTALVQAVWALGPQFHGNAVFVWSTREELGLLGAGEFAQQAAREHQTPATVFAIDTFVSSDSPIESSRFANAELGQGFVVRAIDNSNIAPWADVARLQEIARRHGIAAQTGITGGGNDGATFLRYGAVNVPLSWPLRYSHSPAEESDMRDVSALARITAALAAEW